MTKMKRHIDISSIRISDPAQNLQARRFGQRFSKSRIKMSFSFGIWSIWDHFIRIKFQTEDTWCPKKDRIELAHHKPS